MWKFYKAIIYIYVLLTVNKSKCQTRYLTVTCMGNRKLCLIFDNREWRITSTISVLKVERKCNICSNHHSSNWTKLAHLLIIEPYLFIYIQIPISMTYNKGTITSRNPSNTSTMTAQSKKASIRASLHSVLDTKIKCFWTFFYNTTNFINDL